MAHWMSFGRTSQTVSTRTDGVASFPFLLFLIKYVGAFGFHRVEDGRILGHSIFYCISNELQDFARQLLVFALFFKHLAYLLTITDNTTIRVILVVPFEHHWHIAMLNVFSEMSDARLSTTMFLTIAM